MSSDKTTRHNRVREALGRIYEQQPPYFREYLRHYQEDPTSRVFAPLAEAYRRMGRIEEAIAICKEGLEHHPDFYGGRVALAKCYLDRKKPQDAKSELERVTRAVPENLLAQRLLGDTNLLLGDRASALHCYKMALLLAPSDIGLADKVHQLERTVEFRAELPPRPSDGFRPSMESKKPDVDEYSVPMGDTPFWESQHTPSPAETQDILTTTEEPTLSGIDEDDSNLGMNTASVNELLGYKDDEEADAFTVDSLSAVFEPSGSNKEITTETLGDLYLTQGQFDKALRIFEKLYLPRSTPELLRKINSCRSKLGVEKDQIIRQRQIEMLRSILASLHRNP